SDGEQLRFLFHRADENEVLKEDILVLLLGKRTVKEGLAAAVERMERQVAEKNEIIRDFSINSESMEMCAHVASLVLYLC
ncbi:hypothetical protein, partial [Streptomyces europaeiscabiei]|uniref:hypothetical protein n=1 Tax=Streptomyces europaeiscabiei TaxID=146819 RepID=UPI0038F673BE